jgi:hypothetical protein
MQSEIREVDSMETALELVRKLVDEMPHLMGDKVSYTIQPISPTKVKVLVNRNVSVPVI